MKRNTVLAAVAALALAQGEPAKQQERVPKSQLGRDKIPPSTARRPNWRGRG